MSDDEIKSTISGIMQYADIDGIVARYRDAIRQQVIRELITELEGDRELYVDGGGYNVDINYRVIMWLEEKLS